MMPYPLPVRSDESTYDPVDEQTRNHPRAASPLSQSPAGVGCASANGCGRARDKSLHHDAAVVTRRLPRRLHTDRVAARARDVAQPRRGAAAVRAVLAAGEIAPDRDEPRDDNMARKDLWSLRHEE